MSSVYPVIMAGGSGTRFWPLSRAKKPKQFLPLTSKRPLIVETLERVKGVASVKQSYVVCGAVHAAPTRKLLKGLPPGNVLVEPAARNTAPAIALATAHVAVKDMQGVLVVLPSDQHVANVPAFRAALDEAVALAREGRIVTLGVTPTRPDTGYGYIRLGQGLSGTARQVEAFVEKPNVETAKQYLAEGRYVWNAGIFVFRADVMLKAFEEHMPELATALSAIASSIGTKRYAATLKKQWAKMPSQSIDYGIAEKVAANIAVVPGDFGWSDVGSFNALPEVRAKDERGNVVDGKGAIVIDSNGCVVLAQERTVAVVGLTDVVVVDAGDAVLVLPKDKSQDVRKVVEALKAKKALALL